MPVDAVLLKQIGHWRLLLAESLAARNDLNQRALNSAVRRIIDRLLLLRICEARGLHQTGSLQALAAADDSLARLDLLFDQLNERFRIDRGPCQRGPEYIESPDQTSRRLRIDDQPLRTIVDNLYSSDNNDVFSAFGIELLGHVHEQYLGYVIHCEYDRGVVALKRAGDRKSSGVYYTPARVVQYIVEKTLAPWLRHASQSRAAHLKVLDPACGAGAFLVATYEYLLDWHRQWYMAHNPAQHGRRIQRTAQGGWALTRWERERILLTSIHGVDLDRQAVQVTRLSLLLKLLESEGTAAADQQLELFDKCSLPDLSCNIRCGDSLIGSELPRTGESSADAAMNRPLNYAAEFPSAFERKNPGFDIIVGNPPYINVRLLAQTVNENVRRYLSDRYRCATGLYDIYVLFVERAFDLLRKNGHFGMIVPNKIATLDYARACRDLLKQQTTIDEITDLSSMRVFGAAGVYPYLLFWRKRRPVTNHRINVRLVRSAEDLRHGEASDRLLQSSLSTEDGFAIHGRLDVESRVATQPLAELARIHSGTTGFAASQTADALVEAEAVGRRECFGFIVSGNIDRYRIDLGSVRFQRTDYASPVLPRDVTWLSDNKRRLYSGEKLVIAGMTKRLEVAWDYGGLALGVQVYAAAEPKEDIRYLLGILNSRLISHLFRQRFAAKHLAGGYLAINKGQLEKIPIRRLDASRTPDCNRRSRLIQLVDQRLELERRISSGSADDEVEGLKRSLTTTDRRIDSVVFELYGVTDEERQQIDADWSGE